MQLEDDLVVRIIEDHLHYLETKNYAALVRALKRSPEEVKAAVEIILGLDPRPGSVFNEEDSNTSARISTFSRLTTNG